MRIFSMKKVRLDSGFLESFFQLNLIRLDLCCDPFYRFIQKKDRFKVFIDVFRL